MYVEPILEMQVLAPMHLAFAYPTVSAENVTRCIKHGLGDTNMTFGCDQCCIESTSLSSSGDLQLDAELRLGLYKK